MGCGTSTMPKLASQSAMPERKPATRKVVALSPGQRPKPPPGFVSVLPQDGSGSAFHVISPTTVASPFGSGFTSALGNHSSGNSTGNNPSGGELCLPHQRKRCPSLSVARLEDISRARQQEEKELHSHAPEYFMFSDFVVNTGSTSAMDRQRRRPSASVGRRRRPSASCNEFVFGDFCVSMESELEEKIMQAHLQEQQQKMQAPAGIASTDYGFGNFRFPPRPVKSRSTMLLNEMEDQAQSHLHRFALHTLLGEATRVKCIALSSNEKYYASCSFEDCSLGMHDVCTGREIVSFFGHEDTIISSCFSNDGKLLATTSRDNTMILWDAVTGKQLFIFDHEKVVICCAFSPDSRFLVSGCQDMVCRTWDTRKRREVCAMGGHVGIVVAVAWSPTEDLIASAAADKTVKLWHSKNGTCVRTFKGHLGIVLSCSFSYDGTHIVSNDEQCIKVWETSSAKCLHTVEVGRLSRPRPGPGS
eukprot:RCo022355